MRERPKPIDKNLAAIRVANLRTLIESQGSNRKVGHVVGWGPGFVSHLRTGCSPFTDRSARRIEASFRLPVNWMDQPHADSEIPFGAGDTTVSTIDVLRALTDVSAAYNVAPPLDRLSAVAILVAEDAASKCGVIDAARVKALIALSNLQS